MTTGIVWFKNDLRIEDNETLVTAIKECQNIVPVYCLDDTHFATTYFGFRKMGSFRMQFLLESLADLDKNLRALGSGLVVVSGKPEEEIIKIAEKYNASTVYAKAENATEEMATETKVKKALELKNIGFKSYHTSTLFSSRDLPFDIKNLPNIFTEFRKKVEANWTIRNAFESPKNIASPSIPTLELPTIESLGLAYTTMDSRAAIQFKGGENEANMRLQHYFFDSKAISIYKETRNGMIGSDYSSKLSAWLAMGCISTVTIYHQLKKYEAINGSNQSTYWLVFELLWRDYFYFVMEKFGNKLFLKRGIKNIEAPTKKYNEQFFMQWANGKTNNDFIDANMKELNLTGFMSNRGRQNVASYLCNDLKMDWRYGAAYFEQQLIDYDVCSNWGNWAYIAGVGNDPRPNRYFNIEKQAKDYDGNAAFRNRWLSK